MSFLNEQTPSILSHPETLKTFANLREIVVPDVSAQAGYSSCAGFERG